MTENLALVYASVCIFGVSVCCVRVCFRSKKEWLSHTPPAFSYVLDQTFHLLTTILLCPAAGTLIHTLSLTQTQFLLFPLPPTMTCTHSKWSPPKKQCLYTHTHTLVVVSHNPTPWRVTVADCQPKLAKEPKPRHGRIYTYILYINAHKHSTSTGPALDEQWLKCN